MKVFEQNGKINFVDDHNVFVGFDYNRCCCEQFGWVLTKKCPTQKVDVTKLVTKSYLNPYSYRFDTSFFKGLQNDTFYDAGGGAIFRLINEKNKEYFLTIWNNHNGYYAHGFEMCDNEVKLFGGHL